MTGSSSTYDLLLRGGHVIDPANKIDGKSDVAISGGKIAAVGPNLDASQTTRVLDVAGLYLTPGLVDIHTHAFSALDRGTSPTVPADQYALPTGVTTVVDCGSSGASTLGAFRDLVVTPTKCRVLAFVNICSTGMIVDCEQRLDNLKIETCVAAVEANRDFIVGVKSAHYYPPGWESVDRAVEAGKLANVPVMVDSRSYADTRPYDELLLEHLRPGDFVTHMYRAYHPTIDDNGKVQPYIFEGRKRGVLFDVGHGAAGFLWRNAVPSMDQGFYPDSISTDIHHGCFFLQRANMPMTMSKILNLGMPLTEVIERSTTIPAKLVGHPELGTLSVGAEADIAGLALEEGEFPFVDSYRTVKMGTRRLDCRLTLRAGKVEWNSDARGLSPWDSLPGDYMGQPV